MRTTWKRYLIVLCLPLMFPTCGGEDLEFSPLVTRKRSVVNTPPQTKAPVDISECEDFAVLITTSKLSKKLNRSRKWIKEKYKIPVYADTSEGGKRVIGHAPPGAHCFIVKQESGWYYIQTPSANELGWVHYSFVSGFMKKDPVSLLPCS